MTVELGREVVLDFNAVVARVGQPRARRVETLEALGARGAVNAAAVDVRQLVGGVQIVEDLLRVQSLEHFDDVGEILFFVRRAIRIHQPNHLLRHAPLAARF